MGPPYQFWKQKQVCCARNFLAVCSHSAQTSDGWTVLWGLIMTNSCDVFTLAQWVSQILIRCFLFSFILILFWFCIFLIGDDWAFTIHSLFIGISKHEFDLMNYCGMAFLKISAIIFFLFPYISIRMVLKKNMPSDNRSSWLAFYIKILLVRDASSPQLSSAIGVWKWLRSEKNSHRILRQCVKWTYGPSVDTTRQTLWTRYGRVAMICCLWLLSWRITFVDTSCSVPPPLRVKAGKSWEWGWPRWRFCQCTNDKGLGQHSSGPASRSWRISDVPS